MLQFYVKNTTLGYLAVVGGWGVVDNNTSPTWGAPERLMGHKHF